MFTYSGIHVTQEFGAPTVRDIAVQSMRLPRFCGGGTLWYPVGVHLLLVADLLPTELKHHGLLHDAPEVVVNDHPRPMKTQQARKLEHRVQWRIYHALGLRLPTVKEAALIHAADIRAVNVEGRAGYGPRGFEQTQPGIDYTDLEAWTRFRYYVDGFNPADALDPNGYWVTTLETRLREAITRHQDSAKQRKDYLKAA